MNFSPNMAGCGRVGLSLFLVLGLIVAPAAIAQDKPQKSADPTELFPAETIMFVEVTKPGDAIDLVLNHPIREKIMEIKPIVKQLRNKELTQLRMVNALIEGNLKMKWNEAIAFATSGGFYIARDAETGGVAAIARSNDGTKLKEMLEALIKLAKYDENSRNNIREKNYRGIDVYEIKGTVVAIFENDLFLCNKPKLASKIADAYLDGSDESLATNPRFRDALNTRRKDTIAWGFIDLEKVREKGGLKRFLESEPENIIAEMIVGGLQSNFAKTPCFSADIQLSNTTLNFQARVPHQNDWVQPAREYFFGKDGMGTAPDLLVPANTLLNFTAYRDISKMWLSKEDLLSEKEIGQLAQADSMLSTLFGGLDFGEEVLGAAKPGIQVIAKQQDYKKIKTPTPKIKLPAFAFVFQLNDPESIQRRFKVGFQSLIGFVNIQLGQEEMPQLDIETENRDGGKIISATYLPDKDETEGLMNYNFSPSIAFKDDYFIISSTVELANELVDLSGKPTPIDMKSTNMFARLDGPVLNSLLGENRESLISQNMIEKGNDRDEAETEIGVLLQLMDFAKHIQLKFSNQADSLQLELELQVK